MAGENDVLEKEELEQRIKEVEKDILCLEKTNTVMFPPTDRLTDKFLVAGDLIIAKEYYGDISVYKMDGSKISRIHANHGDIKNLATDGKSLYIHLKKSDFPLIDTDILLGIRPDTGKPHFTEEEDVIISDGVTTEFVGKPIAEVDEILKYVGSKSNNIESMIFSIPLEDLSNPGFVFCTEFISEQSQRFLVHSDMSMATLLSGTNYVWIFYNNHYGEGGCETGCMIHEDKAYPLGSEKYKELANECHGKSLPKNLEISLRQCRLGAEYVFEYYNPEAPYHETSDANVPINILCADAGSPAKIARPLDMKRTDNQIAIMYEQVTTKPKKGLLRVITPNVLDIYQATLRKLELAEEAKP